MTTGLRRLTLTAHVTSSVGWLGAVGAYLVIAIAAVRSDDSLQIRSSFLTLELLGWRLIVPLALAALATGLVEALGTQWGLFRHWWVAAKFLITLLGTAILLLHMPTVSRIAAAAALGPVDFVKLGAPPMQPVVHASGGVLLLLTATALSIYKPWGRTPHGRRVANDQPASLKTVLIVFAVLAFLAGVIGLHAAGIAPHGH